MKEIITIPDTVINNIMQNVAPHWGQLGWVTYKRTYARWISNKNRSEEWPETVKRVVEGNINLDPRLHKDNPNPEVVHSLSMEAQQLFKMIYGLAATPSGRNLWISGTDYQKRNGDSLNNCWFIAIRPQEYGNSHIKPIMVSKTEKAVSMPFAFLFDQLMKGGGVGFSVEKNNVTKIPIVDHAISLQIIISHDSAAYDESLATGAKDRDKALIARDALIYVLPDTREGWVEALAQLIDAHFIGNYKEIVFDISKIRARGVRIHGFGGTASGPAPLIEMLKDVNVIINNKVSAKLNSVDCTDISNLIGKAVVAGNVRRSAEIALGDSNDYDFITMKQNKDKLYHHRWASNNSIITDEKYANYGDVAEAVAKNGEPGIFNLDMSRNYGRITDGRQNNVDATVEGTNPCGEISLSNGEPCNLFEVFPSIAEEQGWKLKDVVTLAARYTKRITFSHYDWEVSRQSIAKNRRIGVSLSGIQDWFLKDFGNRVVTGFNTEGDAIFDKRIVHAIDELYHNVVQADNEYSAVLACNRSIKHTTVKPSGTVSKLAGVSEGMHFHYSNYLIQRIRFQETDPLLPVLQKCGYHIEPDVYTKNTKCVEFPVKSEHADSEHFASAGNVSIAEQLATQAFLQKYWSDNAVSCTITFQPSETQQIAPLLAKYRNAIKSTSLLPYAGDAFEQAPKQPITKTEYKACLTKITDDVEMVYAREHGLENQDLEIVGQQDCVDGSCPIK
ncbi:ribonucleoside-triphosphate reductase [Lactiplantibacillus fabifermentans T30PCM01]|uniref:Adenosylcobalamin-dependent ribonucleoside-triphosphate reductase n=1 Tax=Lactiplantibacillus fabifermentans T30PCM01 TaxID=1400520 RepID=W6T3X3_9LACO|nr:MULTISPECIES: ribonucleoside-triphosphate reductase, adenosylcobalamin-dependent [Lactobacillaceae]ETY72459.1 ribonucleoside-triphosphate reductase [Lactiplantibacillus fabifermentans T30PCM01]MDV7720319.1 ribonucleoside-triphosphate reductase, adenosylcobalamin-dependent [Pediococcus ethanolidurans]